MFLCGVHQWPSVREKIKSMDARPIYPRLWRRWSRSEVEGAAWFHWTSAWHVPLPVASVLLRRVGTSASTCRRCGSGTPLPRVPAVRALNTVTGVFRQISRGFLLADARGVRCLRRSRLRGLRLVEVKPHPGTRLAPGTSIVVGAPVPGRLLPSPFLEQHPSWRCRSCNRTGWCTEQWTPVLSYASGVLKSGVDVYSSWELRGESSVPSEGRRGVFAGPFTIVSARVRQIVLRERSRATTFIPVEERPDGAERSVLP
jgi:hypothetical protein